ncbi:hypothetical protein TOPH_06219 [Tolypocladium ophioglossoides CBS 100239]|uniref:Uncharacterized protein n=1 Tax=Tolypocladium ophioglossoides (strain CBS 100239) TaxID=1163406 RepID=A0A0L0N4U2_TOLOC|nr:hypothetical protein TOPH_06219 [Tolypocladium ophioglossoides CBS 100239]
MVNEVSASDDSRRIYNILVVEPVQLLPHLRRTQLQLLQDLGQSSIQNIQASVLDLGRYPDGSFSPQAPGLFRLTYADAVAAIGADFSNQPPAVCFHQHRAKALVAGDHRRVLRHGVEYASHVLRTLRNSVASLHDIRCLGKHGVHEPQGMEWQRRGGHVASIDAPFDGLGRQPRQILDGLLDPGLDRMTELVIIGHTGADCLCSRHHTRVLAGAITPYRRRNKPPLDSTLIHLRHNGRVPPAAQIALLVLRLGQHAPRAADVPLLAVSAGFENGECLHRLGRGADERQDLARAVEDGGVDFMAVLDDAIAIDDDEVSVAGGFCHSL